MLIGEPTSVPLKFSNSHVYFHGTYKCMKNPLSLSYPIITGFQKSYQKLRGNKNKMEINMLTEILI